MYTSVFEMLSKTSFRMHKNTKYIMAIFNYFMFLKLYEYISIAFIVSYRNRLHLNNCNVCKLYIKIDVGNELYID